MPTQPQSVAPAKAGVQDKRQGPGSPGSRVRGNDGVKQASAAAGIREAIRTHALAMGFDVVGFAEARLAERARTDLAEFLDRGYHGDMGWLAATAARRGD